MICRLELGRTYQPEIKGFGEIYEITSVVRLQNQLKRKFHKGTIFLCSNLEHKRKRVGFMGLKKYASSKGYRTLQSGFVDSSPFGSNPRRRGDRNHLLNCRFLVKSAKIVARILTTFEFLWESKQRSHMIYIFGIKKDR